ncbi:MAG: hypothetical protein QOK37_1596 [Thermoanaerobaculia bacterium]|jgi:hypothetical protein|nr:hypothetical protein [Thermoanaerobaculia bacterium]
MTSKQSPAVLLLLIFLVLITAFAALPASAQDAVTIGTVTASGNTVDVPVYIRDASGTPLGLDQPAGSRIQSFSITVNYSPSSAVQAVSFSRAGITSSLNPAFESSPSSPGSVTLLETFQESSNLIPFALNAPPPGDHVAHLIVTLSSSAAPGSTITLTLDSSTQLSNQGGTASESGGSLALSNGAINVPQLTLDLLPSNISIFSDSTATLTAQTSANVSSATTVTLNSSNPGVATVPPSVVIPTGARSAQFTVTGVGIGSTTITASLPPASGGATAAAHISVTEPPVPCDTPAIPQLNAPVSAEAGKTYSVSWAAVARATDYVLDESTDVNFIGVASSTVTGTTASFTHPSANRYYYRIRARNTANGCNTTSLFSSAVSVLISVTPLPQTRFLPVVGSTAGSNGAYFKTSVQLFNPKSATISGKIVFHPQAASGASGDPSLVYAIAAGKSLFYPDLLPAMGVASGIGSADVVADAGVPFPIALVRVFNDAGAAGTTGLAEEVMQSSDALKSGDAAALIAPADVQRFRLNIGVRTLDQGVAMTLTVRDKSGVVVKTTTRSYPASYFVQPGAATMLDGYALTGEETITIAITSGSAFIYGSTTDNITQDPSVQFAKKIE